MNIWQIATGETGRDYRDLFTDYDVMILGPAFPLGDASVDPDKYWDGKPNSKNNQVWAFANKPEPGDMVIMRFYKEVIGIGQIPLDNEQQYSFQDAFKCVYGWDLCHTRRVIWADNLKLKELKDIFEKAKQKPAFSGVNEPHIHNLINKIDKSHFDRPLKGLPTIDSTDYTDEGLGQNCSEWVLATKTLTTFLKH